MTTTISDYKARYELKELELNALLEITQAINNNLPEESLYKIYNFTLRANLNIDKMALFVFDETWSCKSHFGGKEGIEKINLSESILQCEKITRIDPGIHGDAYACYDIVIPIAHKTRNLAFVFVSGRKNNSSSYINTNFVHALSNIIIVAIENKKLARRELEQERFRKELEIAGNLQSYLFPKILPDTENLKIKAFYQPHHSIGGDYYDFIPVNEHQFFICIADVSGKGIPAAMLMSNFQASLRTLARKTSLLQDIVGELNYHILSNAEGHHFITVFLGMYDFRRRRFKYINSGHNPPLLMIDNQETVFLDKGSTVLGAFNELPFMEIGVFEDIDRFTLMAYTDGITEAQNADEEEYGVERLERILKTKKNEPLAKLSQSIIDDLNQFRGPEPIRDDLTLLICQLNNTGTDPLKPFL
jgi:phosphoserine phosphatase RsbU/P